MKEKLKSGLKRFFDSFIWLGLILLIGDLVSKLLIVANKEGILSSTASNGERGVDLIPGFLKVNYLINNTLVFGIDLGGDTANRIIFCIVASLIVIGLIIFLVKKWKSVGKFYRACLMMILAGAIGNLIDRIFYSPDFLYSPLLGGSPRNGVVDWIDFYGIWGFNFNIADSSVVVAAFMLIIYMLVVDIKDAVKAKKENKPVEEDNTKVLSKTEMEKNQYLEKQENKDE